MCHLPATAARQPAWYSVFLPVSDWPVIGMSNVADMAGVILSDEYGEGDVMRGPCSTSGPQERPPVLLLSTHTYRSYQRHPHATRCIPPPM